jgi:hypothetical protein
MEQLRKTPFININTSSETVTSAGRNFTVATTVCNDGTAACGGSPAFKKITVTVTPLSAGQAWMRSSVVLVTMRSATALGPFFD